MNIFAIVVLGSTAALAATLVAPNLRNSISRTALDLAAMLAVGATAASLYLSEVAGFIPCELCWYQRIAMYPLAALMTVAVVRRDHGGFVYATPLAVAGLGVALYHVQLQLFPNQSSFCDAANPCTSSPAKAFDLLTIPQMSAMAFALFLCLALLNRHHQRELAT